MKTNRRKKVLRWSIGGFFTLLLMLTFLSNTILGLSLPKISVEQPVLGALELTVEGGGFLVPSQTAKLYAEGDWTVESILKRAGDRVEKGETLIVFDPEATIRALEDERARFEQQKLQLDKMNGQWKKLQESIEDAKLRYAQQELQLEKMTDQLKEMIRGTDTAVIENLKRDIRMHQLDMEAQQRKIEDRVELENMERDLRAKQLDIEIQERKIAEMERQIDEGAALKAPFDGVITALTASAGALVGRGQSVVEIADDASGYEFEFTVASDEASVLRIDETVSVWIEETPRRSVEGVIAAIEDHAEDGRSKRVVIEVQSSDLKPGMKVSCAISHFSDARGTQIPVETLKSDSSGDYVLTVKEEDGPLGTAYYVQKTYVTVKDENETTAVVEGLMPQDRIVAESSEPLSEGDRVRYSS